MKKLLVIIILILDFAFSQNANAQKNSKAVLKQKISVEYNKNGVFNEAEAILFAKAKGIQASEIRGYVEFLKNDFSSKKALESQSHIHTPYETSQGFDETVIYLNQNKTMSVGCPNMGFENYNFSGWTGDIGKVSTGATEPSYFSINTTILNPAGNNVSVRNTSSYHTIMTIPTITNNLYPNCSSFGYDSLACRVSGTSTISQIPFVSPYSYDPVSVRLQQAVSNYRAARLKYITTTSASNKTLAFSYALVLNDPSDHTAGQSPYFKVEVKDESTGLILPGCTSYTFNPKTALPSDSLLTSSIVYIDVVRYRKWRYYTVNLSALPLGTDVSVTFEVGGCSFGGHFGYAYVDAECGGIAAPYSNMCSGTTFATLVAPPGFSEYQWIDPSGNAIVGGTNDTLIANPAAPGEVYTIQMLSPGGCTLALTNTITLTSVSIININTKNSCAGGNTGTAKVLAGGSNSTYTYKWTSTSGPTTGSVVGTGQTATGLAPGSYSVLVASPTCVTGGTASDNINIGAFPPLPSVQTKTFCGSSAIIPIVGGSDFQWYGGPAPSQTTIPGPIGNNDTLFIPSAKAGDIYTATYKNAFGCNDSAIYTLTSIPGGNAFLSGISNVCPSNTNGSTSLNLNTSLPAPYNYYVTGPGSASVALNTTTASKLVTISSLAAGVYTFVINDGACIYTNTFEIFTIVTDFTVSATNTLLCFPKDTAKIYLNFKTNLTPVVCGTDPSVCSGSATQLLNTGPFTFNSEFEYPTPYGNYATYVKNQFLVRKADLNAVGITAGKISSLAFNVLNLNTSITNYPNFFIKMGCSTLNALPDANDFNTKAFITGLTTVYSAASQTLSFGWVTHNFPQSFLWDGISNIIIEVCFGMNQAYIGSRNVSVELKQMPYTSTMFYKEFASPVCAGSQLADNNGGMLNAEKMLPNMRFGYCPSVLPASAYTVAVSSNGTITANYGNDSIKIVPTFAAPPLGNVPTVYTITAINPQGLCTSTQTVAILYPSSVINLTTVPTSSIICDGSFLNLSASGSFNYNWSYSQNGSLVPISNTPSISVTPTVIGNNFYIVTGTSPCNTAPDSKTVTVTVIPKANLLISPLQNVAKCLNKFHVVSTIVNSATPGNTGEPYSYNWTAIPDPTTIGTSSSYTATSNITTTLVVNVNGVCAIPTSDTVVIKNLVDNLAISILDSSKTCANTPFNLSSVISGDYPKYNFSWFINGNTSPIASTQNLSYTSPSTGGTYTISVSVIDSCSYIKYAYEVITVLPPCPVEIPNIITPNGDGVNELFIIKNIDQHPNSSLIIFDRWGRKVYENPHYNNEWNGEGISDGTYFYLLDVPDEKRHNGFLTVFRQ